MSESGRSDVLVGLRSFVRGWVRAYVAGEVAQECVSEGLEAGRTALEDVQDRSALAATDPDVDGACVDGPADALGEVAVFRLVEAQRQLGCCAGRYLNSGHEHVCRVPVGTSGKPPLGRIAGALAGPPEVFVGASRFTRSGLAGCRAEVAGSVRGQGSAPASGCPAAEAPQAWAEVRVRRAGVRARAAGSRSCRRLQIFGGNGGTRPASISSFAAPARGVPNRLEGRLGWKTRADRRFVLRVRVYAASRSLRAAARTVGSRDSEDNPSVDSAKRRPGRYAGPPWRRPWNLVLLGRGYGFPRAHMARGDVGSGDGANS